MVGGGKTLCEAGSFITPLSHGFLWLGLYCSCARRGGMGESQSFKPSLLALARVTNTSADGDLLGNRWAPCKMGSALSFLLLATASIRSRSRNKRRIQMELWPFPFSVPRGWNTQRKLLFCGGCADNSVQRKGGDTSASC